ncbi:molecular chaperone HtpG [Desulfohalovibrio reitneri]|uniref:molecular chaperone HtpG n=1 Tax=Desulfohalovibrio reitneri TaxID=1307759 RepID=UPI0004A71EB2|nr:molecular chaperone HtpG [Desulfohalovibrio reitneri]
MSQPKGTGNFKFKAEVNQLLNILVHSLYSNREIFLRELVANASDALDKLRFQQLQGAEVEDLPLQIDITCDPGNKTLTVADSGVGMTREEMVQNLGTIAHSGTAEFVKNLSESTSAEQTRDIIGQFGVGFYSVFMVADEVAVTSKSVNDDEPAYTWKSNGQGSFSVSPVEGEVGRGTTIRISLKEDATEFAQPDRVKSTIRRHSGFVSFPVMVDGEKVNTVAALWREPKFQITREQYDEFYQALTYDTEAPLDVIHLSADAPIQFNSLFFVPKTSHDLLMGGYQGQHGVDLYVRRILIQHQNKDVLPEYLGFLRGVVDSEDLPLNISRETLQENLLLQKISRQVTKQVLSHLQKLATNNSETYEEIWNQHGKIFKLGYTDFVNKDAFAELLRFNSSHFDDDKGLTSLDDYISRMKEEQDEIYFLAGQSRQAVISSPHLEMLRRKGVEVLYLFEPIDEFVMDAVGTHKEYKLVSAEHADPAKLDKLPDTEEAEAAEQLSDEQHATFEGLLSRMKDILGARVTEVRESKRLKDSPIVLVSPDGSMTSSMQKIMRVMSHDESTPPRVMEVNPDNELVRNLLRMYEKDKQDPFVTLATEQLFESAMLLDGYLEDPHGLVNRVRQTLTEATKGKAE